jgi:putative transposase
MPTGEQQRAMRQFAGACRFVYNKALALQKENHAAGEKSIGYVDMAKRLTQWRNSEETPWLKDAPVHAQQHALKASGARLHILFRRPRQFPALQA